MRRALLLAIYLASAVPAVCWASPASIERGRWLAQGNCASCHAMGGGHRSPNPNAPPFGELRQAYPTRNLNEIFADGVLRNHSGMPQFAPGTDDMADLLDYLESVQVKVGQ